MPSKTSEPGGPPAACPACGEAVPDGASFCLDCGADLDGAADPAYCADCGAAFDDDDRFCSNCGASRSERSSGPSPSRSAASPDESERAFRRRVQDHLDAGWDIEQDAGDRVILVDRGIGSVGVHILLFFFTSGIGNLLYGWWHYSKLAERRRLVRGDSTPTRAPSSAPGESRTETVAGYLLIALLFVIGGWIAFLGGTSGSVPGALIGLAFIGLGLGVAPPVRRRLDRRHGVTDFGRQKTVDHRIVRPPESVEEPCVVCDEAFDRGLVRRRRDETVVAGVPVRTHSVRYNHYCADCARSELFADDVESLSLDGLGDEEPAAAANETADATMTDSTTTDPTTTDATTTDATEADSTTTDSVRESADRTD
ncbi:zinc ribbon domain-containing protein [Halorubrum sp. Atlit-8R]|uniref:zinc-ribbon domain-containing protein n=1 Tax=unclassified Halorubrum TaxID=2642239 RepID=UPI000EF1FB87|nr:MULTISPECIES: zinc-ribbon domain-containing protein [unclassified Halorubrum]RLM70650.1 zinc ribbon domain-containing protein [Halorubrum sp. Atlit-9R]RLM83195.1 zinc ribbon domain-containing protein [Halorubrum sp. Atlit-8R]